MGKTAPKKTGRPSIRTDVIIQRVIDGLSAGTPLAVICREKDMPCPDTLANWEKVDADLSRAIARARELGFDAIAQDGLNIVDNVTEDPASRRVRADYRLKLLAKWDPKRYGDKVSLDHGGSVGMNITVQPDDVNL